MTIAVNDAAIIGSQSPANWYTNGSTYMMAINPGAYLTPGFTGTSLTLNIDTSIIDAGGFSANAYPFITFSVDGGAVSRVWIVNGQTTQVIATGLTNTTHTFRMDFTGSSPSGGATADWWGGQNALRITGFVVDTGKVMTLGSQTYAAPYYAFGDSITAGVGALNNATAVQSEDPTLGYQALLANWMARPYCNAAFSGQAWNTGGGNVPGVVSSYNFVLSGVPRTFSPVPAVVTINEGRNGGPTNGAQVVSFLGSMRSACDSSTAIFLIIPFDQSAASTLTAGYNSYHAAHPTELTYLLDLGSSGAAILSANTYDGVHPNAAGYALLASALEALMAPLLGSGIQCQPGAVGALLFSL